VDDFELVCLFTARSGHGISSNGGIEFRSTILDRPNAVLRGLQVDLATNMDITGALWESAAKRYLASQGREGSLSPGDGTGVPVLDQSIFVSTDLIKPHLRPELWNHCRIVCLGGKMAVYVNERLTATFTDHTGSLPGSGRLGVEISSLVNSGGFLRGVMGYRDILLTPLMPRRNSQAEALASRLASAEPARAALMSGVWNLLTAYADSPVKSSRSLRFKDEGILEQDGADKGRWWLAPPNRIHIQFAGDPATYSRDAGADFTLNPAMNRLEGFSANPSLTDVTLEMWAAREAGAPPPQIPH
jgi:hypothetical protein